MSFYMRKDGDMREWLGRVLLLTVCTLLRGSAAADVPREAVEELGVFEGVPLMKGFVFVDGRYLVPPYTVTRRGNGIFINRILIEKPVPWSYFAPTDGAAVNEPQPAEAQGNEALDPPFEALPTPVPEKAPQKVESIDDLFGDAEAAPPAPAEEKQARKTLSSIDDLFGDGGSAMAPDAPAQEAQNRNITSIDDLFIDDLPETPPQTPGRIREPAPQKRPPLRPATELTPQQLQERKEQLKKILDERRSVYEKHLAQGELYFLGTTHNRVNGTYGSARALFEVLPDALRYARTPMDLLKRLHDGNLYFIDHSISEALFRNRNTFPLLHQRLEQIKQDEAIRAARQKE
jgi:hypothetical protein